MRDLTLLRIKLERDYFGLALMVRPSIRHFRVLVLIGPVSIGFGDC